MNKRQRKKNFIREFSKLYDESLKYGGFKRNMSISTFRDGRGTSIFLKRREISDNVYLSTR